MFDAHFHIIDPRFPLVPNEGYLPAAFGADDYRAAVQPLRVDGGAVVSGSFQAFDQSYLEDALRTLGPRFVGVTQLPVDVTDEEILRLHRVGVRAVRFNLRRGGSAGAGEIETLGRRVYDLAGWHSELYLDARHLPDLSPSLCRLPLAGIDHLGLSSEGLPHLLRFVERGGFVKATGFGRIDFDPVDAIQQLVAVNAEAVVFGTDLPSTRAPRPFAIADIDLITNALDEADVVRVLSSNAERIYLTQNATT